MDERKTAVLNHFKHVLYILVPSAAVFFLLLWLVPLPRTVDAAVEGVLWDTGEDVLLDHATMTLRGRLDRYLFRDDRFRGTLTVEPVEKTQYAASVSLEQAVWIEEFDSRLGYGVLSGGYIRSAYNTVSPGIASLFFDNDMEYVSLYLSELPDSVRFFASEQAAKEASSVQREPD